MLERPSSELSLGSSSRSESGIEGVGDVESERESDDSGRSMGEEDGRCLERSVASATSSGCGLEFLTALACVGRGKGRSLNRSGVFASGFGVGMSLVR